MIPKAVKVRLRPAERAVLKARLRAPTTQQRQAQRARIVLLAAAGRSTRSIAREVKMMPRIVSLWRGRFAREGLAGLEERPRGRPRPRYTAETGRRILAVLERAPPPGYGRWTGPLIAAALGDVHEQQVWRFLRAQRIDLDGRKSWCESPDPDFAAKAADIVGLYLDPPKNAIVVAVDEKPHIQALERAQGYLRLPNGRALAGHGHTYTRHGTTTLFAALEVATGEVRTAHYQRRRRVEFLNFMNGIVAAYPDKPIHVVLDNLSTHKPKRDRWLARHRNVHFHFTPTYASWLNQVEIWFSILSGATLDGASFTSPKQIREAIDAFVAAYNRNATPFHWTKSVVHQKPLKPRITHV
jgi:transposase